MASWRPPQSEARRQELAIACARDGYALLEAVYDSSAPGWLRELPAVDVLRRVLLQNYTRAITSGGKEVIRRREKEPEGDGLPPGHARIASPNDLDARWGVKREEFWLGCKLHIPRPATTPAMLLPPGRRKQRRCAGPRAWQGLRAPDGPEPDHQRGHHRRHRDRQPDDRRHPRRPGREEPGPGTALPRFRVPQRRPGGLRARQVRHRAGRAAAGRHLRAGPRRGRLHPRR